MAAGSLCYSWLCGLPLCLRCSTESGRWHRSWHRSWCQLSGCWRPWCGCLWCPGMHRCRWLRSWSQLSGCWRPWRLWRQRCPHVAQGPPAGMHLALLQEGLLGKVKTGMGAHKAGVWRVAAAGGNCLSGMLAWQRGCGDVNSGERGVGEGGEGVRWCQFEESSARLGQRCAGRGGVFVPMPGSEAVHGSRGAGLASSRVASVGRRSKAQHGMAAWRMGIQAGQGRQWWPQLIPEVSMLTPTHCSILSQARA